MKWGGHKELLAGRIVNVFCTSLVSYKLLLYALTHYWQHCLRIWFYLLTPLSSLSCLCLRDYLMVTWIISRGAFLACFLSLWLGLKNSFDSYSETIAVSSGLVVAFICAGLSEQCHGFPRGRMALTLEEEKRKTWYNDNKCRKSKI